jgi:polyisoprenoid-binding protein YceI
MRPGSEHFSSSAGNLIDGDGMFRYLACIAALTSLHAFAGWTKNGDADVTFVGIGPAGFKVEGKTKDLEVSDDGKVFTVVVPLKNLSTGIALRDSHMRDKYCEVSKHPNATLTVPVSQIKVPEEGKSIEVQAVGSFNVHGKSKELPFKYTATMKAGVVEIDGALNLNLKDHEINVPSYLGITVKPDIVTHVVFKVRKE